MPTLSPKLADIVARLLARNEPMLDLDVIAEEIGAAPVTWEDIDAIMTELERRGRAVGASSLFGASEGLALVLTTARRLKTELGRTPTIVEIEKASGLDPKAIRTALLFARTVQR